MQTEIPEGRCVTCYFVQVVYEDSGEEVARSKPHTITFMPDTDYKAMLVAINNDITTREGMKWNPIEATEWARALGHCAVEHTPEIKAAYERYKAGLNKELQDGSSK